MTTRSDPGPAPAASPAPSGEALVGKRVLKYEIVRVIGRGGMGTVYEAVHTAIGKHVAMKFVDADAVRSADAVARFQREAQAASAVESAHIVDIFDTGISEDGLPFIVMELLRGEDLGHRIKRCGRLELHEAVHVTAQILRGLHRAHKAGIIHRDLKPDNIFLVDRDDDPNFAKILDFGISKVRRHGETPVHTLTRQGTVLGTPFYMSPEQAQAQPDVDARSDLWSVGAILYECLTGRPPYTGATYEQVIVNICMNDAEDVRVHNPGVPEPIAHVIAKALERDRADRFDDARDFLGALRTAAGGLASSRTSAHPSEDSFPDVSSEPPSPPVNSRVTPRGSNTRRKSTPGEDPALDATVKVRSTPSGRRSGSIAERRRAAAARQRLLFVVVAVSALLVGGFGAFVVRRLWVRPIEHAPAQPLEATSAAPVPPPPSVTPATPTASTDDHAHAAPAVDTTEPAAPPPAESSEPKGKIAKITHTASAVGGPIPSPAVSAKGTKPIPSAAVVPATSGVAPGLKLKTD